jgi:hypothetical protein
MSCELLKWTVARFSGNSNVPALLRIQLCLSTLATSFTLPCSIISSSAARTIAGTIPGLPLPPEI